MTLLEPESAQSVPESAVPLFGVISYLRADMLRRLYEHLDFPISELVIVQYGDDADVLAANRDFLSNCTMSNVSFDGHDHPRWSPDYLEGTAQQCERPVSTVSRVTFFGQSGNQGVSHGWNLMLRLGWRLGSAYMLVANADIYFHQGQLGRLHGFVRQQMQPNGQPSGVEGFYSCQVHGGGTMPFAMFIVTQALIRRIGLFDENIYPAYFEDTEYAWRMNLLKLSIVIAPDVEFVHGDESNAMTRIGGGQIYSAKQATEQMRWRHRAAMPMYVANKWGLTYQYNKWHWINSWRRPGDKVGLKNGNAVVPSYESPWNSTTPLAVWEFDTERVAYIANASAPRHDTRASCRQWFPQLLIVGLAAAGADAIAGALGRHDFFTGPSCSSVRHAGTLKTQPARMLRRPCAFDEGKAAERVIAAHPSFKNGSNVGGLSSKDSPLALAAARGELAKVALERRMQVPISATYRGDQTASHPLGLLRARQSMEEVLSNYVSQKPWALPASKAWSHLAIPLISDILSNPLCLLAVASPASLRQQLSNGTARLSAVESHELWERHLLSSLHACAGIPKLVVYEDFDEQQLLQAIGQRCGNQGQEPILNHTGPTPDAERAPLHLRELWRSLTNGTALAWAAAEIPFPRSTRRGSSS